MAPASTIGTEKPFNRFWRQFANVGATALAAGMAGLLAAGCATSGPNRLLMAGDFQATISYCPYQIAPLDSARLIFTDGSVKELTVSHDGGIATAAGPEKVAGRTVSEFKFILIKAYPQVATIEIREFKEDRISVLGEVFHQIHTELGSGPMRVMDAVAAANGFTPLADKQHVRLVRENAGVVATYVIDFNELMRGENMQQNMLVKAGDVITVGRNFL